MFQHLPDSFASFRAVFFFFYDSQASALFCSTLFGSLHLRQTLKKWLYRRGFSSFESLNTLEPVWLEVNRWLSPWEAGATPGWNWTTMPGLCSRLSSGTRWGFNNALLLMINTLKSWIKGSIFSETAAASYLQAGNVTVSLSTLACLHAGGGGNCHCARHQHTAHTCNTVTTPVSVSFSPTVMF